MKSAQYQQEAKQMSTSMISKSSSQDKKMTVSSMLSSVGDQECHFDTVDYSEDLDLSFLLGELFPEASQSDNKAAAMTTSHLKSPEVQHKQIGLVSPLSSCSVSRGIVAKDIPTMPKWDSIARVSPAPSVSDEEEHDSTPKDNTVAVSTALVEAHKSKKRGHSEMEYMATRQQVNRR
jgi:hypothetical protein